MIKQTRYRLSARWYFALLLVVSVLSADQAENTGEDAVVAAVGAFQAWTRAYSQQQYQEQRDLTHRLIRRWWDPSRYEKQMKAAHEHNGELINYSIVGAAPATAEDLPCTEMGHCYRPGIEYVLVVINSEYENVSPPQPEFVVMARDKNAWFFGGGTFLNRPFGESSVIMTQHDERRYTPKFSTSR